MTWKQFKRKVEDEIRAHSVDPEKTVVDVDYIEADVTDATELKVRVNTAQMPRRCSVSVTYG
jgi:hypothetical protein